MHDLLQWLREQAGDGPPCGSVDQEDVADELEDTPLGEGYERED